MSPCLLWTCPSSVSWWGLGNGDDKCMIAMPVGMSIKLFHCQSVFRVHYSFYFTITLSTQNRGMMNGHISCIRWAQQRDYTRAVPPGGRERGRTDMLASASCLFPMCVPNHSGVSDSLWPHGDSPGKNTGVGCHTLLQGIIPTQGSNPGLPHCGWILYRLSHQGNPQILEWVACPFSRGTSWPWNWTRVSCIAGRSFTTVLV